MSSEDCAYGASTAPRDTLAELELLRYWRQLGPDEQRVLMLIGQRMAKGRAVYGEYRTAADERNHWHETAEEHLDACAYMAMQALKQAEAKR